METIEKKEKKSVHIDADLHKLLKQEAINEDVDLQVLIDKKLRSKLKK